MKKVANEMLKLPGVRTVKTTKNTLTLTFNNGDTLQVGLNMDNSLLVNVERRVLHHECETLVEGIHVTNHHGGDMQ